MDSRSASGGHAAAPSRTAKNTNPPTMAMCRPEIDSTCASPESRIAWVCSGGMKASCPVTMAVATPPVSGPSRSTIRRDNDQRKAFTAMAARTAAAGGRSPTTWASPTTYPTPPIRRKKASRAKS